MGDRVAKTMTDRWWPAKASPSLSLSLSTDSSCKEMRSFWAGTEGLCRATTSSSLGLFPFLCHVILKSIQPSLVDGDCEAQCQLEVKLTSNNVETPINKETKIDMERERKKDAE